MTVRVNISSNCQCHNIEMFILKEYMSYKKLLPELLSLKFPSWKLKAFLTGNIETLVTCIVVETRLDINQLLKHWGLTNTSMLYSFLILLEN